MNGDDYVIDGDLAFSDSLSALNFYQKEYHRQLEEINNLKKWQSRMLDVIKNLEAQVYGGTTK